MEKSIKSPLSEVLLCVWCGILLGSANTVTESICIRCYKLLVNAGIEDEKIFSDTNVKENFETQSNEDSDENAIKE